MVDLKTPTVTMVTQEEDEQNLFQLVYLSSSDGHYTKDNLVDILTISRRNNTRDNVTGIIHICRD